MTAVLLVVSGATAAVVMATRPPADNGRLTVTLDAGRSAFAAGSRVRIQQGREPSGSEVTSGGARWVSAAHSSTLFHLRGHGRYFVMVMIWLRGTIEGSCVAWFHVNHTDSYSATIRLIGKRCRVDVSRNGVVFKRGF